MKIIYPLFILFFSIGSFAQAPVKINEQTRYNSDSRVFYVWDEGQQAYAAKDSEFENSIIEIREINSKNNGYIILSLVDDGKVRMYHGSIISYNIDEDGNPTWVMRSKNARGKLVLNPKNKTFTFSYESNEVRYLKIFVFHLNFDDEEMK